MKLERTLNENGVETMRFYEPDYDQVTAIGLVPSDLARKLTSSLRLCGKTSQDTYTDVIIRDMMRTEQMTDLTVYEHGKMVNEWYHKLIDAMKNDSFEQFPKVPKWVLEYKDYLLNKIEKFDTYSINEYQIMHDCGKPYCLTTDEDGRKHFPNHAKVSHDIYLNTVGDEFVANLLLHDMDMHTMKANDIDDFIKLDGFLILMLTSLAEIYANSTMFGGTDSTNFKIKFKQIDKRGNAILKRVV